MKSLRLTAALFVLLASCATQGPGQSAVPDSGIRPAGLLDYTYQNWRGFVARKYNCSTPKIVAVSPNKTGVAGVISEIWHADVCGQQRRFVPILSPDGQGGYLVAFGE